MNTDHNSSHSDAPAIVLGQYIRNARKKRGLTIADLADRMGRPREWLNRIELGHSEYGGNKPATQSDLSTLIALLGEHIEVSQEEICRLGKAAEEKYDSFRISTKAKGRNSAGKLTQAEVIIGEEQIGKAIVELIREQHSDAVIRNSGIKGAGSYNAVSDTWKQYRDSLGEFLAKNPNALFKRVEFADTSKHLQLGREADERLAGGRDMADVHNAKIKFHKHNPLQMHVLIGQREAIIALPQSSGQAGSNMALLVRDKLFVEALRVWYDEVLWDSPGESKMVRFSDFDGSFEEIQKMYGFGG